MPRLMSARAECVKDEELSVGGPFSMTYTFAMIMNRMNAKLLRRKQSSARCATSIKLSSIVLLLVSSILCSLKVRFTNRPIRISRRLIIPVGRKSTKFMRVGFEVRTSGRRLLRRRSFASSDHNHGEGVGHAEWTSDGQFFVFNTFSSGGHQPWHVATYSIASGRTSSIA